MSVNELIAEGIRLFESNKVDEAIVKFNRAWSEIKDKNSQIEEQNDIQWGLGRCCLEQAIKTKDVVEAMSFFARAIMYFQEQLKLVKKLTNEQTSIQEQIYAQHWLGRCYLEQAMKVKDIAEAKDLFAKAVEHNQERLKLAEQLTDEQTSIQEQIYAQSWLGGCYLEQAIKIKDSSQTKTLIKDAEGYFLGSLELLPQLDDEKEKYQIEKRICYHLRNIFFLRSKWNLYFDKKKQEIRETLFSNKDKGKELNEKLEGSISTILAVLHIPPIELGSTPLAHYTSSSVCNKLFGVVNEDDSSPMRIGSSSYMNDPSEGKGLLELLALQDLELENKVDCSFHNAFFACFSSRVNDLNQFRLYGKEDGVEASGCCLVFNKNGDWLKVPDISAPFRSITKNQDENLAEFKEANISNVEYENLPLYQVAYIAYKDEYIAEEKCQIWLDNFKFGICLKSIGENNDWHNFRIKKLEKALQQLIDFFKVKDNINDENKNMLEYIRYLFKDFAFRDEEEFRVLKMAEIGSEEIEYCKTTKSIYLPYADISNVVDEVILGTNYEKTNSRRKAEVFQHQMRQKCPNVKVSRSSLPIYANPPIKKD
ncbi:sel1 repeat family protein [Aggregatibacter sp.]